MNFVVSTDTSPGFAVPGTPQNLTTQDASHLAGIFAAYTALDQRPLPDTTPTPANISSAILILRDELLGQFGPFWRQEPFDEPESLAPEGFANALSMVIQPLVMPFISEKVPLYWVDGDGAWDYVEVVSSLYFPEPTVRVIWRGDHSFSEQITEGLQWSPSLFWIDGEYRKLSSRALEQALCAKIWTGAISRGLSPITLPIRCLWVTTGIKTLSDKLLAQSVKLEVEQIKTYGESRWESLPAFVVHNRPRFYGAAVTLVRGWLEAGKPMFTQKDHFHSDWSQVMGGILSVADVPGFLSDR